MKEMTRKSTMAMKMVGEIRERKFRNDFRKIITQLKVYYCTVQRFGAGIILIKYSKYKKNK